MNEGNTQQHGRPRTVMAWKDHLNPKITFAQLAAFAFAVAIGAVAVLLAENAGADETLEFSTVSLIGFVFSVALGGASIVLAISAIGLGRASEHTMTARSDDSLRLQNEVFEKTMEALQRIESSTGVTEKRIEDIISGRVGAISEKIAAGIAGEPSIQGRSRESLEEEIRESLLQEVSEQRREERASNLSDAKQSRDAMVRRDHEFRDASLLALANSGRFEVQKIGVGWYAQDGINAFDGVFKFGEQPIGVALNTTERVRTLKLELHSGFVAKAAAAIAEGTFQKVFLAYDSDLDGAPKHAAAMKSRVQLLRADLASNIHVVIGEPRDVAAKIIATMEGRVPETAPSDGARS